MLSLWGMPFFIRGLLGLCAVGCAFPVLGTFILNLELIAARFAVMHAALLGAALALLLGLNPIGAAMGTGVIAGIAIAVVSWRGTVSAGGSLGLIMTVCMGVAFIIFYKSNVHAIEAFNIFWGNILSLTQADTRLILITATVILLFLIIGYKEIHIVLYDRELAWAVGVRAKLIYGAVMLSVCLGIAAAMRVTGALMVDVVTILPALAARRLGKTFKGIILWGSGIGVGMNLTGFALSFVFDLPVSSAIIVIGGTFLLILHTADTLRRKSVSKKAEKRCFK